MDSLPNIFLKTLQHIIFPSKCPICHKATSYGCKECVEASVIHVPTICINCGVPHTAETNCKNFIPLYTLSTYNDNIRELIIALKFHNYKPLGKLLGHIIAHRFKNKINALSPDYIVPIPNHKDTKRTFSHTEEIALGVSDELNIPVMPNCIEWKTGVTHQLGRTGAERENLTCDSFRMNSENILGKKIILVDDVYTTGSTVRAATLALKNAGAKCKAVFVIAKQIS